jgi:murein DD-endopeptidase MepM/ murein hydrolase activator NlpD
MRSLIILSGIVSVFLGGLVLTAPISVLAQTDERPLILPMAEEPGLNTWLFGQPYGNTVTAYNTGSRQYSAGQGLHFGLDFSMPCGTPLVAVADGEVVAVDDLGFGSAPHNLLIRHPQLNYVSLYGHLLGPAPVSVGQQVRQGDVVAYSGDPDETCVSRPHMHYELRSLDYFTTYNPVNVMDTAWNSLGIIGSFNASLFQVDLYNARQWVSLDDQPDVHFGGGVLNNYAEGDTYPTTGSLRPSSNPPIKLDPAPFDPNASWQTRTIGVGQCCAVQWWDPLSPDRLFVLDGEPGVRAVVSEWSANSGQMVSLLEQSPPPATSPDGSRTISLQGDNAVISNLNDGSTTTVFTSGATPLISTDNTQLVWTVSPPNEPGADRPPTTVNVANTDGTEAREILSAEGVSALWLDADRLLLSLPGERRSTTLAVYDTRDNTQFTLGTFIWLRNLTISPDGARLMFYTPFQEDPANSSMYVLETQPDAQPQKIGWFGGWRWRDAESVYYIPFQWQDTVQTLHYYNVVTGEDLQLTTPEVTPFGIMNGEWSVSPDGQRIVFRDVRTREMTLLEVAGEYTSHRIGVGTGPALSVFRDFR